MNKRIPSQVHIEASFNIEHTVKLPIVSEPHVITSSYYEVYALVQIKDCYHKTSGRLLAL